MPIPVAKLQEPAQPLSERVLAFLRTNPTQAYNAFEIYGGIQGLTDSALAVFVMLLIAGKSDGRLAEVQKTLQALEQQGLIQSAQHMNMSYYAVRP